LLGVYRPREIGGNRFGEVGAHNDGPTIARLGRCPASGDAVRTPR
jgi:hypothetical protein